MGFGQTSSVPGADTGQISPEGIRNCGCRDRTSGLASGLNMQEVAFVLCLSWSNSIEISSCKEPQLLSGPSVRTPCRGTASNSRGFVAQASWAGGLSARGEVGMEGAMRRASMEAPSTWTTH